ncbi:MAG: UvrD-helicase domain-containing protein [Anaerovoracaceae bacterium]|nr:UvrD-helicase domain-containing protein [Anaerovoracaceae bacterium]
MRNLNSEQRKAVEMTEGPLLILAGAGSGKTATMTHRIAHLIKDKGVPPYNILAVTFTNKAAGEMRERVEELLGGSVNMWIMTFHAACLRILRMHADVLGYGRDFVVYDPVDTKSVIKKILKEQKIDEKTFNANGLLSQISACKEQELSPDGFREVYEDNYHNDVVYEVYREYDRTLRKNNAMDFDDLLLNTVRLFEKDETVLAKYQDRFHYIMVDEYQDTNKTQYKFVAMLADRHKNICVVGDDDQCIYQWRGADITNILNFERDFPGAQVIKLEQNYRSTGKILAAAHSVIENNHQRKAKKLWTEAEEGSNITYRRADNEKDEAAYVAQEIIRVKGPAQKYSDFAVLYRTNSQSRTFEEAFSARDIPYKVVGGVRYYDRKEIKDMIAYMRLVLNPSDDLALTRIINEPKRGIGTTTVTKLTGFAAATESSLFEVISDEGVQNGVSAKAGSGLRQVSDCIRKYHDEMDNLKVSNIYDGLLNDTGYLKALETAETAEAEIRMENLLEFKSVIFDYEEEGELTLADFLERIALISDIDNHDPDADAVVLMTMHSAKGLEFPYVFMPGMEDGLFPGWRSIDDVSKLEEERRLCYVGMTRAMEQLWLTSAAYRVMYGSGSFTRESTFLRELDPKLLEGDGVFRSRSESRFGEAKSFDGYQDPAPARPFDRLARARREVKKKKEPVVLAAGDRVKHDKFGEGLVITVKGNVVEVAFDSAGMKKLAADVAPLTKL